jgi:hypothetical protein
MALTVLNGETFEHIPRYLQNVKAELKDQILKQYSCALLLVYKNPKSC